jgi:magnesium chelatase family protein
MLAARLPGLLPELTPGEMLEVAGIASIAAPGAELATWARRPFRAPHHTASAHAIVGGGPKVRPGEISLAHRGVLFLDELPEFDRRVLEALREPLESERSRCRRLFAIELPAAFQLIVTMNPAPRLPRRHRTQCRCGQRRGALPRAHLGPLLRTTSSSTCRA